MMMEKLKVALYVLLLAGVLTACSDDDKPVPVVPDVEVEDGEPTAEELAEMAAADKFAAANSVYRALALIDELPDNWESAIFEPSVGVAEDAANPDVRKTISTGADDAEAYFHSIVPDLGLNGNTWSHEGIGTLTFRAVNKDDCYAELDVNLVQMPGLKLVRFVPQEAMADNASFTPFYRVGDVVQDMKDDTYWICVRPAGGPKKKDYAYFVSFDEKNIKTTKYKQTIYDYHVGEDGKISKGDKNTEVSGEWTYGKNLVEERIALAAAHTFCMLYQSTFEDIGFGFRKMAVMLDEMGLTFGSWLGDGSDRNFSVAIPYGSPKSNSNKKIRQEQKLQPTMAFSYAANKEGSQYIFDERVLMTYPVVDEKDNLTHKDLMSLTTDYDPLGTYNFNKAIWGDDAGYDKQFFDIIDYSSDFSILDQGDNFDIDIPVKKFEIGIDGGDHVVMLMTQMRVKDNGKPSKDYSLVTDISHADLPAPDYWGSLQSVQRRVLDEKHNNEKVEVYE